MNEWRAAKNALAERIIQRVFRLLWCNPEKAEKGISGVTWRVTCMDYGKKGQLICPGCALTCGFGVAEDETSSPSVAWITTPCCNNVIPGFLSKEIRNPGIEEIRKKAKRGPERERGVYHRFSPPLSRLSRAWHDVRTRSVDERVGRNHEEHSEDEAMRRGSRG